MTIYPKRRKRKSTKEKPRRSFPEHEQFVRNHECINPHCKSGMKVQCHHLKSSALYGIPKEERAWAKIKTHSKWSVPACVECHGKIHSMGEAKFDEEHGTDLGKTAQWLASTSPQRWRWDVTETLNAG